MIDSSSLFLSFSDSMKYPCLSFVIFSELRIALFHEEVKQKDKKSLTFPSNFYLHQWDRMLKC